MPSFNVVNYSLRPNKAIQRSLVFEGVKILQAHLNLEEMVYIGLGSIWFTDFQLAHKFLHVKDMISFESNEIGFRRAKFNQPFKTITIKNGLSHDILPELFTDNLLSKRPWLIWLDYDDALEEAKVDDIRQVIEKAPSDSILLVTLPAVGRAFGKPANRPDRIRKILGNVVPNDLTRDACKDEALSETLLNLIADYMSSVAATAARPGGFIRAFRLAYRDGTPMITVGGILPSKGAIGASKVTVSSPNWPAITDYPIVTPPLTLKEAAVLQSQLPATRRLTRRAIQRLGFDLEEDQLRSFERFYRYYPIFAQIST